ncbi:MAG: hypothetical protein AAB425_07535 [Bdellovibrionota bacterium]
MPQKGPAWIDGVILFFFPTLRLHGTPWLELWRQKERERFLSIQKVILLLIAVAYTIHFLAIDLPLGMSPVPLWFAYRFGIVGGACAGLLLARRPLITQSRYFALPLTLLSGVMAVLQARSMLWSPAVPYFYAFVLPAMFAIFLRMALAESLVFLSVIFAIQWPIFLASGLDSEFAISAEVVTIACVLAFQSRMGTDVQSYVSECRRQEAERQLIESELELHQQVRSFLPKEIYRRLTAETKRGTSVTDAAERVLRPRTKTIACLFTDIRGYTSGSRTLGGYVLNGCFPNIRQCTEAVERERGIPRHVGDLLFVYFDDEPAELNLARGLRAAIELAWMNHVLNRRLEPNERIKRYVLLSYGQAVVGNIGGTEGSREITALGDPANILSRIDPLTKDPGFARHLSQECVILTDEAGRMAKVLFPELNLNPVELPALGLSLRDFPEQTKLWIADVAAGNRDHLNKQAKEERISA